MSGTNPYVEGTRNSCVPKGSQDALDAQRIIEPHRKRVRFGFFSLASLSLWILWSVIFSNTLPILILFSTTVSRVDRKSRFPQCSSRELCSVSPALQLRIVSMLMEMIKRRLLTASDNTALALYPTQNDAVSWGTQYTVCVCSRQQVWTRLCGGTAR